MSYLYIMSVEFIWSIPLVWMNNLQGFELKYCKTRGFLPDNNYKLNWRYYSQSCSDQIKPNIQTWCDMNESTRIWGEVSQTQKSTSDFRKFESIFQSLSHVKSGVSIGTCNSKNSWSYEALKLHYPTYMPYRFLTVPPCRNR